MRIANLPLGSQISKTRVTVSLQSSRKTALLLFFLFKECGPLSCCVCVFAVAALYVLLSVLLLPIFWMRAALLGVALNTYKNEKESFLKGPAKAQIKAYYWNMFEDIFAEALNVVWLLCLGMSV